MPEFTRTKMSIRRQLPDGGTIGLLRFVEAHERGKMTDEQRDEIVELLNRGACYDDHVDELVFEIKRLRQMLPELSQVPLERGKPPRLTPEGRAVGLVETDSLIRRYEAQS